MGGGRDERMEVSGRCLKSDIIFVVGGDFDGATDSISEDNRFCRCDTGSVLYVVGQDLIGKRKYKSKAKTTKL